MPSSVERTNNSLPVRTYMPDESPRERWLTTEVVVQILVWVAFCVVAAGALLGTLALVKC
jgi:hypothetical protein